MNLKVLKNAVTSITILGSHQKLKGQSEGTPEVSVWRLEKRQHSVNHDCLSGLFQKAPKGPLIAPC